MFWFSWKTCFVWCPGLQKNTQIYSLSSGPHITAFQQLLHRNGKISSISLSRNKRANRRWQQSYFTSISVNHKLNLTSWTFDSIIISKQIKYYLAINGGNFLQIQYGFYRRACRFTTSYDGLLLKEYLDQVPRVPRTSQLKIVKFMKSLLLESFM